MSLVFLQESLSHHGLDSKHGFDPHLVCSRDIKLRNKGFSCFAPFKSAVAIIELVLGSAMILLI